MRAFLTRLGTVPPFRYWSALQQRIGAGLRWVIERCAGRASAHETAIGYLPDPADLDISGLELSYSDLQAMLSVDAASWREEMAHIGEYFQEFGDRVPAALRAEYERVVNALN